MFKKSTTNKQLGLFTTVSPLMCKCESKQYEDEKAWHMQFYRNVTCNIDEDGYCFILIELYKPKSVIRKNRFHFVLKQNKRCILC